MLKLRLFLGALYLGLMAIGGNIVSAISSIDNVRIYACENVSKLLCVPIWGITYFHLLLFTLATIFICAPFFFALKQKSENVTLKLSEENLKKQLGIAEKEKFDLESKLEIYNNASQMLPRKAVNLALRRAIDDHFGGNTPNTFRISVYTHYQDQKAFSLVGRFSPTFEFNTEGRSSYPEKTAGVIYRAFNNIDFSAIIRANPNTDYDAYVRELVDGYGMEEVEVRNLSMKCRALLAKRISGGSSGHVPIGVALIETTRSKFEPKEKDALDEVFKNSQSLLAHALHIEFEFYKLKKQLPHS